MLISFQKEYQMKGVNLENETFLAISELIPEATDMFIISLFKMVMKCFYDLYLFVLKYV